MSARSSKEPVHPPPSNTGTASGIASTSIDFLKKATQSIMPSIKPSSTNQNPPSDDDNNDLGDDLPRSGVLTPRPDPSDKRLPGIMSNFMSSQVSKAMFGTAAPSITKSFSHKPEDMIAHAEDADSDLAQGARAASVGNSAATGISRTANGSNQAFHGDSLLEDIAHKKSVAEPIKHHDISATGLCHDPLQPSVVTASGTSKAVDGRIAGGQPSGMTNSPSVATPFLALTQPSPASLRTPSNSTEVTSQLSGNYPLASALTTMPRMFVSKDISRTPSGVALNTLNAEPIYASHLSAPEPDSATGHEPVIDSLRKRLTSLNFKSGASTPARAMSTANLSQAEGKSSAVTTPTNGSNSPKVAQNNYKSTVKGKVTIRVLHGRNLKFSGNPRAVVVFQRNEHILVGAHSFKNGLDDDDGDDDNNNDDDEDDDEDEDDDDDDDESGLATNGVPIAGHSAGVGMKQQASDIGRSIPIWAKSRQSSSTSTGVLDRPARTWTRRTGSRQEWDAEAVFDVVDDDLHVNISVYDHKDGKGELLGQVDLTANAVETVGGWFPLKSNLDTNADKKPNGELFVQATYQSTDRKHFGPDDFQILKLVGKGTFGQVYQVRKKDTNRIYAMKVLSKKVIVQKKEVAHTLGERNILVRTAMSDSPFIVGLKFSFQTPTDLYLVTDYMSGGELFWHLQHEGRFSEKRAKFYIAELILAIKHLHDNDIVYRDLKPENILLDANGHIALCDFGLSKANLTKNDTTNTFCGTTEYLAPEVLLDETGYTKMVDFWSLGVLVFEMCCGWSPFYADDTQQMYKNIAFGKVRFPRDSLSFEGRNFVKGLLNRNPKHRLGAINDADELKEHAFFDDINWDALAKKQITPPFKPKLTSETDVSYFDPEFTNAPIDNNTLLDDRAANLARDFMISTPLSPSVQANFQGFTYVDESALEDHMANMLLNNTNTMSDMPDDIDNRWDDLRDLNLRQSNSTRATG